MAAAELSDEDKAALRSGFPGIIYARLAGLSLEDSFGITLRPPVSPLQIVFPQQLPPQQLPPQQLPLQLPLQLPPQLPPVFQLPPQLPPVFPPPVFYVGR